MAIIKLHAIGSGLVWIKRHLLVDGLYHVYETTAATNVSMMVNQGEILTIVGMPSPVVGIYDKWVDTISNAYVRNIVESAAGARFVLEVTKTEYDFTCYFLNNTKVEPPHTEPPVTDLPPTGGGTEPIPLPIADGEITVGTCKIIPMAAMGGLVFFNVKDITGTTIYSGNTKETAIAKATSDSRCQADYTDPSQVAAAAAAAAAATAAAAVGEKPPEKENNSELLMIAGIGLLAIVVIYLSGRKN